MLKIAKLGNPILRKIAAPVDPREIKSSDIQGLIDEMFEVMYDEPGIGLAAPQVSRSIQLVVMGCKDEGGFPETVLINPSIVCYGPEQVENWEGCLSVPGFNATVVRPERAVVQIEVRREVMSQPIYRAWQFLTGKLAAEDKIEPQAKRTSSPDSVDETQDSLFAAIAKLGDLQEDEQARNAGR